MEHDNARDAYREAENDQDANYAEYEAQDAGPVDHTHLCHPTYGMKQQILAVMGNELEACYDENRVEIAEGEVNCWIGRMSETAEQIAALFVAPAGWVSIDDVLPEVQTDVLVYCPRYGAKVGVAFLTALDDSRQAWMNHHFEAMTLNSVSHWMFLPAPPTS